MKKYETKNSTAIFELTGIKIVDDFIKQFSGSFTHPRRFGATPFGTPDLSKTVQPTILTSDLIFDIQSHGFKMNIAEFCRNNKYKNLIGSVKNETPEGFIKVMKMGGEYLIALYQYAEIGDGCYVREYKKFPINKK